LLFSFRESAATKYGRFILVVDPPIFDRVHTVYATAFRRYCLLSRASPVRPLIALYHGISVLYPSFGGESPRERSLFACFWQNVDDVSCIPEVLRFGAFELMVKAAGFFVPSVISVSIDDIFTEPEIASCATHCSATIVRFRNVRRRFYDDGDRQVVTHVVTDTGHRNSIRSTPSQFRLTRLDGLGASRSDRSNYTRTINKTALLFVSDLTIENAAKRQYRN